MSIAKVASAQGSALDLDERPQDEYPKRKRERSEEEETFAAVLELSDGREYTVGDDGVVREGVDGELK